MINLLPLDDKKTIRAARQNVILVRYLMLFVGLLVFIVGAFGFGLFMTMNERASAETEQQANQAKANTPKYNAIRKSGEEFSTNLNTAKKIGQSQVVYSSYIIQIGNAVPEGVILANLNLDANSFDKPTTLTFKTTSYDAVLRLKQSLENSPIINNVSILTVVQEPSGDGGTANPYPFTATMNLTISKVPETAANATPQTQPQPGATP